MLTRVQQWFQRSATVIADEAEFGPMRDLLVGIVKVSYVMIYPSFLGCGSRHLFTFSFLW
jgi:hypothetical protein